MTRRLASLAAMAAGVGIVAMAMPAPGAAAGSATTVGASSSVAAVGDGAPVTVSLANQTWFLPGNGRAQLTVRLDTTGIPEPRRRSVADRRSDPPVQIEIEAHQPIATPAQLDEFVDAVTAAAESDTATVATSDTAQSTSGDTSDDTGDDTSDTAIDGSRVVDTVRLDLRDTTMRNGRIVVRVVVEPEDDDDDELAMPQQGIHPLVIRVIRADTVVAEIPTFVERLAWGTTDPKVDGVTELAVWGRVESAPTLRSDGTTVIAADAIDELDRIRQTLADVPGVPLTLALRPELIDGLARADDEKLATLRRDLAVALGERALVAEPFVAIDPSAMEAADLEEAYIDELRRGEDVLADAFPRAATVRSVAAVTSPLTGAGADLLRDLGVRNVVMLERAVPPDVNTDASLAREIVLPSGGTLQAHVVDAELSARIDAASSAPALFANHLIARMLLWQRELTVSGASIDGRSFVLASSDGSLPGTEALRALSPLVARDPRLRFSTLDAALGRTDVAVSDGVPEAIDVAAAPTVDLSAFAQRLRTIESDVAATGSMLPAGDERLERWGALVEIAPSEALTDDDRAGYLGAVANETAALRAAVVPPPETTFTLGGRSGDVNLSVRNDADVALTVVVRMSSPKLLFPEGPATVELAPGATTIVRIPVQARSNNTFPVTVEVLTPWQLAPVTAPVQLTARVTAFTGLGQVVTGAAVLILATWWVRHWRTARRRRLASSAPAV